MNHQRHHLGEIGQRRFTGVTLPIGIAGEADRGVEGEVRANGTESLRIEREQMLQSQDGIGKEAAHQAEQQHGKRILFPILLVVRLHPHHTIGEPFQGPEDWIEPGPALCVQDLNEIQPHRFGD